MSIEKLPPALIEAVKKFLEEKTEKPDFFDVDKDGNKKEPMKKAVQDKKRKHPTVSVPTNEATGVAPEAVDKHNCATHVYSESYGEGRTLYSQHAEPDENGNIAWYDVMFDHGIEKRVMVEDLQILQTESHMRHKKKKKG